MIKIGKNIDFAKDKLDKGGLVAIPTETVYGLGGNALNLESVDKIFNLKNSKKFLQISVGVSTQYDEKVIEMVDQHQLALRSVILSVISDFSEESISGSEGKNALSEKTQKVRFLSLRNFESFRIM